MRHWAIRFKLANIKPVPKSAILLSQTTNEQDGNLESNLPGMPNTAHRSTVSIAPAQSSNSSPNQLSYAQMMDDLVEERKKRRRIKNRIAAARSNERRRIRRQLGQV